MTLPPCPDRSSAAWITGSELPWQRLVSFGPSGFPAYARLRFMPDPTYVGQKESDVGETVGETLQEAQQLQQVLEMLKSSDCTPDKLFFCFWEGSWGHNFSGPTVDVPNRSYFLLRGDAAELGEWRIANNSEPALLGHVPMPAFVWPADHTWCVANDVDPHWAGIGASTKAIHQLMGDPRLDLVLADPQQDQPAYR
jgi:hypothetical protein